ncbi:MAG: hypothetical protein Q9227_007082 [Pyrenula ochraceoflavens]
MADQSPTMNGLSTMQRNLTSSAAKSDSQSHGGAHGPTPNRGSSVPDTIALGPDYETQDEWRRSMGIDKAAQVKIVKLSHMRYQHEDLEKITTFLQGVSLRQIDSEMETDGARLRNVTSKED